ncbi:hypothetical protein [Psychroserpens mesophilus]|uniref:hypothetical protein n=1 Tax=Psychroserpens mesophilus TaxID=325473 RepID=UPI003D660FD8
MEKTIILLFSILTLISCKSSEAIITVKNGLIIENARIISPENQTLSLENYIVLDGDEIIFIGVDKPNLKGAFKTTDAKGKYIIPGLIDSHVHVTGTDALSDKEEVENPMIVKSFRKQLPKSYLYFGYTTLIDLGTVKLKDYLSLIKLKLNPTCIMLVEVLS